MINKKKAQDYRKVGGGGGGGGGPFACSVHVIEPC